MAFYRLARLCRGLIVIFFISAPAVSIASNITYTCPHAEVSIETLKPINTNEICLGARDALVFLANLGIEPIRPIVIEIRKNITETISDTAVGCYLEKKHRAVILKYPEFQKVETWFNVPIEPAMYRSVVTHEVAHAISDYNFLVSDPTIQAKEYVAYVAMFVTMNENLRKRILHANPGSGFDSELKINTTIYLCDPMHFGVEAYRHYLKKENGDEFLLKALAGKVLRD